MKECVTHHAACDCRERRIQQVLRRCAEALANPVSNKPYQALVELDTMHRAMYGRGVFEDEQPQATTDTK